jgi:nucleoside 2-deoxyribosyltransferase
MRIYLAGPDVFLPDPHVRAIALKAVCERHGLTGVSPLDPIGAEPDAWRHLSEALRIAARNEAHMRSCDILVANLTPFRGPSADVGTIFELGFMRALGRPVFGWSNAARTLTERTLDVQRGQAWRDASGAWRDGEGLLIESFGLVDNLMIDGGIAASGGRLITQPVAAEHRWSDLAAFERCLEAVAARLS